MTLPGDPGEGLPAAHPVTMKEVWLIVCSACLGDARKSASWSWKAGPSLAVAGGCRHGRPGQTEDRGPVSPCPPAAFLFLALSEKHGALASTRSLVSARPAARTKHVGAALLEGVARPAVTRPPHPGHPAGGLAGICCPSAQILALRCRFCFELFLLSYDN